MDRAAVVVRVGDLASVGVDEACGDLGQGERAEEAMFMHFKKYPVSCYSLFHPFADKNHSPFLSLLLPWDS